MNIYKYTKFYLDKGWAIFPVIPRGKQPIAELVEHGVKNATVDYLLVKKWWGKYPDANIGLSCELTNMAIVDLDTPQAMTRWHLILDALGYKDLHTAIVRTAKGEHWYFKQPESIKVKNTQKGKNRDGSVDLEKIELRGVGGYVVLPPSVHETGVIYEWQKGHLPSDGIATMPLDVLACLQPPRPELPKVTIPSLPRDVGEAKRHAANVVRKVARELAATPSGAWHQEILRKGRFVGQLVGAGSIDEEWAFATLLDATARRKDHKDSEHTLKQALEFGQQHPLFLQERR